jgi:hypothetical protein
MLLRCSAYPSNDQENPANSFVPNHFQASRFSFSVKVAMKGTGTRVLSVSVRKYGAKETSLESRKTQTGSYYLGDRKPIDPKFQLKSLTPAVMESPILLEYDSDRHRYTPSRKRFPRFMTAFALGNEEDRIQTREFSCLS